MATSVFMAATDNGQTTNTPTFAQDQDHHHHHPIRRSSGRKKSKGGCESSAAQKKNKQPQRGMGVEKLERLRLQDGFKKMTEISQGFGVVDHTLINASSASVHQFSKMGVYGSHHHQMGLNHNQNFLGFNGLASSDHLQSDVLGVGCLKSCDFVGKNVSVGLSKELSSTPNAVKCYSQHCNACHKKKKFNGENLGSDKQMHNVGDCGFLGLNIGDNQNVLNQEIQGFAAKTPLMGYTLGNSKQGVEVVAVHRKGSSSLEGGNLVMEYEFFPSGKAGCDSQNDDEMVMMKMVGASQTSSSSSMAASNCIDLSLKLSY